MNGYARAFAAGLVGLCAGCDRDIPTGPPEIRLGRDECAGCGMMINEDRCSSALLVESAGTWGYELFDDIGCMLDYEREKAGEVTIHDRFVHDYNLRTWLKSEAGDILLAPEAISTPMASGIVAIGDHAVAESLRSTTGARIMNYVEAGAARREWKAARRGVSQGMPAESAH